MTFEEYRRIDAVNWSSLKELRRSPLHYRHALSTPRRDSDAFKVGRAAHTLILEPHRAADEHAIWTGGARRGKDWDGFKAAHSSRTILTMEQNETACLIADSVLSHPVAANYLGKGLAEQTVTWLDESTGLRLKGRLDWVTDTAIVDLKTTRSIEERQFAATVASYGYHSQLAMYRAGWKAAAGDELRCVVIAVESEAPHDVAVYELDENALYAGEQEVRRLLKLLVECRAADKWPGRYPNEIPLELPAWAWDEDGDGEDSDAVKWLMTGDGP